MGWEDRPYYRDRGGSRASVLWSILGGSVPLFTAFGIRVRAHASLFFLIATVILFDYVKGFGIQARAISMAMLVLVVILHEFGHCFAARSVGGTAEDILLWPLGGLAFVAPPRRPWPTFVTVAGGPLVNVVICVFCIAGCWFLNHRLLPLNPFNPLRNFTQFQPNELGYYLFLLNLVSYDLFLFNLLPIFPLDGGQIFQTALWPKLGYRKATDIACVVGMAGACLLALYGLYQWQSSGVMLIAIAVVGFLYCRSRRMILRETGDEYSSDDGIDYSASLRPDPPRKRRRPSRWLIRRLRKQAERDNAEQQRLDSILGKVSAHGITSLTWSERRALRRATERQRQAEFEVSRRD